MITRNRIFLPVSALQVALVAVLFASPAVSSTSKTQYEVKVTGTRVNVRAQPTTNSDVLFQVTRGNILHLIEKAGDWYLVESPDEKKGYVYGTLVELIQLAPVVSSGSARRPSAIRPAARADEDSIAEAQERSWAEKKRTWGLYKLAGGGAALVTGMAVMRSSKPAGVGLMGAGGYFLWDGYQDRKQARRRLRWSVILHVNRDVRGVAYHMSW